MLCYDYKRIDKRSVVKSYKEKHPNAFKDSQKPTFSTGIDTTSANNNTKINELRKAMGLPEKKI